MIILNILIKEGYRVKHSGKKHGKEIDFLYLCRAIFHVNFVNGISLPFFTILSWKTG